jgi:hypothetical protein
MGNTMDTSNIVAFRQPGIPEARLNLRPEGDDPLVLFCEIKEEGDADFKVIAKRYSGKRWINEKGWRVSGTQPGDNPNKIEIQRVLELNDDDLFVGQGITAEVPRGHLKEIVSDELKFTVGQVRKWRDDPNRCQCEACQHVFPRAVQLLAHMEDWVTGKITRKRLEIKARKLGYDDFVCVSA